MTGNAPCSCGYYHEDVRLTGERESDGEGGWHWRIAPGCVCCNCGEPLVWLHEPGQETLIFPAALAALHARD